MDPALYGLAGVVVGALIGALGQLLAERARQRDLRRREFRSLRFETYVKMLSDLHDLDYRHRLLRNYASHVSKALPLGVSPEAFEHEIDVVVERINSLSDNMTVAHAFGENNLWRMFEAYSRVESGAMRSVEGNTKGIDQVEELRTEVKMLLQRHFVID